MRFKGHNNGTDFNMSARASQVQGRMGIREALVAALVVLGAISVAAGIAVPEAHAVTLAQKKARAAQISAQVSRLESQLNDLQERTRYAQSRLGDLDSRISTLSVQLDAQKEDLEVAWERLIKRVVIVYETGAGNSQVLHLAQSRNLRNLLDRIDTIRRVSQEDADIITDIEELQRNMKRKKSQLRSARSEQAGAVRELATAQKKIATKRAARAKVLGSVTADIRKMVAAQQAAATARTATQSRARAATVTTDAPSTGSDLGSAISPPVTNLPPASGAAASAASIAMQYIGVPYKWGGASPSGFDCSGLVMYAFAQVGISLPHSSYALWNAGPHVSRSQLQVGDLVFAYELGHVGIYIGGDSYVHAPQSGDVVKVAGIPAEFIGGVRIS